MVDQAVKWALYCLACWYRKF